MTTNKKYIEDNLIELTNNVPEGMITYYNTVTRDFEIYYDDEYEPEYDDYLVIVPCSYYLKGESRKRFRDSLNDEERELANSYYEKRGYISYLKEVGLYERLVDAEYDALIDAWERWIIVNKYDASNGVVVEDKLF